MEMLQLRYFYESAKNESFAKTAEKHLVPTTSVSASVKRLEGELGCALFDRTANRITLNENGQRLQRALHLAFCEIEDAVRALSDSKSDTRAIRMLVRAVRSNVTDSIIAFSERNPHISFATDFDFTKRDVDDYDVVIDRENEAYADRPRTPLWRFPLYLKAAKSHPFADKPCTLRQLSTQKFISWGEGSNMHRILLDACRRAGFEPQIAVLCNDKACYERLIAAGVGIGIGREDGDFSSTVRLDVSDFDAQYAVFAYCRQQAYFGNVKQFIDFLKNMI
jgi:LysR family transcriptional activator of glutamate synthase operon